MNKPRDSHIFAKAKSGFYVEPSWCSERLFDVEKFTGTIWDPACGWGTITTAAVKHGYDVTGSDIVDRRRHGLNSNFSRRDFLTHEPCWSPPFDFSVVTNPPFDHVEAFARKALSLGADQVAMIMLVRRLNAAHWLRELPLRRIYLLSPRPSMPPGSWIAAGNKPGGGTQDFCWLLFDSGYRGQPQLRWLRRDGDAA
jgi:hypothetical protein